jgi:hypothetical protein
MILQNFLTLNIFNIFTCLTLTTTLFFWFNNMVVTAQKNKVVVNVKQVKMLKMFKVKKFCNIIKISVGLKHRLNI